MIGTDVIVVGLTMPIELVAEIDRLADASHESRAAWLRRAVIERLAREAKIPLKPRKPRRSTKDLIRSHVLSY